jgi:2-polyprenyl-6-methoxyphenol hydroxylase-like FAD-dependent oxidoreductase
MGAQHVVVIGAGIGGMCAARVLSDHFGKVTLIERDELGDAPMHRKGVPQSRHPHGLLDRGRRELNVLFPGLDDTLHARGGLDLDAGLDLATLQPEGWARRRRTGHQMLFASRLLIEAVIRARVKAISNVHFVEATEVTRLLAAPGGAKRITGVETRRLGDNTVSQIEADLVVDCSGRSSRAPGWLGELGYAPAEREVVDADAGYSTCWYQAPPAGERPASWWWKGIFLNPSAVPVKPEDFYFALTLPIEGDRFLLTLASWGGRPLPADHDSFAALCAKLRSPIVAEALAISKPISAIFHRRGMQNIWNHYERWSGPAGFVSVADAVCGFNPVYAQGMTSAAVCSRILGRAVSELEPADPGFPAEFYKRQAEFVRQPWALSVARDRQALAQGRDEARPEGEISGEMWERIMREGAGVPVIAEAIFDVINLNRPPETLVDDKAFVAAVTEIMQRPPRPPAPDQDLAPYPPAAIVN